MHSDVASAPIMILLYRVLLRCMLVGWRYQNLDVLLLWVGWNAHHWQLRRFDGNVAESLKLRDGLRWFCCLHGVVCLIPTKLLFLISLLLRVHLPDFLIILLRYHVIFNIHRLCRLAIHWLYV